MNKKLPEDIERQIEVDIPRTFPSKLSVEQKNSLENILRVAALNHPIIGYVQGMNFIAGFLLLLSNETTAMLLFHKILTNHKYNMYGLFQQDLPYLDTLTIHFKRFFHQIDNSFFQFFESNDINLVHFVFVRHWISLFTLSRLITWDELKELWTHFLDNGWDDILIFSIGVLKCHKDEILKIKLKDEVIIFLYTLFEGDIQEKHNYLMELNYLKMKINSSGACIII